jgi:hypothetical protein
LVDFFNACGSRFTCGRILGNSFNLSGGAFKQLGLAEFKIIFGLNAGGFFIQ